MKAELLGSWLLAGGLSKGVEADARDCGDRRKQKGIDRERDRNRKIERQREAHRN